jgi:hypothetical protein
MDDAGHSMMYRDQPDAVLQAIHDVLNRVRQ